MNVELLLEQHESSEFAISESSDQVGRSPLNVVKLSIAPEKFVVEEVAIVVGWVLLVHFIRDGTVCQSCVRCQARGLLVLVLAGCLVRGTYLWDQVVDLINVHQSGSVLVDDLFDDHDVLSFKIKLRKVCLLVF